MFFLTFFLPVILHLAPCTHGVQNHVNQLTLATAKRSNDLGIRFYTLLSRVDNDNILFSPVGLTLSLGMTRIGTRGNTSKEIDEIANWNPNNIHQQLRDLKNKVVGGRRDGVHFDMTNALLVNSNLTVRRKYKKDVRKYYNADIQQTSSLVHPAILERSNNKTNKDLVFQSAKMEIVYNVRLEARWEIPFSVFERSPFYISAAQGSRPNNNVQADYMRLMSDENQLNYYNDEENRCQIIEINYGKSPLGDPWDYRFTPADVSMVIVLPNKGQSLQRLEQELTARQINGWLSRLEPTNIDVSIPKFNLSGSLDVGAVMRKMGIKSLFSQNNPDLSNIVQARDATVQSFWQKTNLAASVAGTEPGDPFDFVSIVLLSSPKKTFYAVRPFFFLVRDKQTNTILFIGRIANPNN